MMEHEISRFNPQTPTSSSPNSPVASPGLSTSTNQDVDLGGASQALKQTELANQLAELNKVLVAKQELAGKMGDNDEKLLAMRKKYEDTLKSMEVEIAWLQKEKDELAQQQRVGDGGGNAKMSEIRRKRIQELAGKMGDNDEKLLAMRKKYEDTLK